VSPVPTATEEVIVLQLTHEVLTGESLQTVWRCLEGPGGHVVHLDLGGIRLPTAEGLGALVALNRELRARGGMLLLVNVPVETNEILTVTHLVEVLHVRARSLFDGSQSEKKSTRVPGCHQYRMGELPGER
jgi:anti-anti-sigma regulatory factor